MKLSIFLLVVFSITVLCVEDKCVTKFKNQHIIETDTEKSCDDLIKEKKIKDNNKPKLRNTFIINAFEKVKDICKEEQRVYENDNLYTSSETMITLHDGHSKSPNCIYAGQLYDRRIVVLKCNNKEPVDLDSTIQIG
uniref:Ribonuclease A-domain domain-containing protein n=1 Tax=Oreochromis niloticus TaxID=8128 RepID=A0A669DGL8_ORENI